MAIRNASNWPGDETEDRQEKTASPKPRFPVVLIVDDEVGFRSMLQWNLTRRGMLVEIAENGVQALELLQHKKFDLVITDLTMPKQDGLKVLSEVKRLLPQTEVIMVTGFGTVETAVYAMQQGAFDFILKPFDLEKLIGRVAKALNGPNVCPRCKDPNCNRVHEP